MKKSYTSSVNIPDLPLWEKTKKKRSLLSFDIELTARCSFNCRHCYINVPSGDNKAIGKELSAKEISRIADEAVQLGALWCLLTGGEPLLRKDFSEIYISLKKKGLLVSVFTHAALITDQHIHLFKKYPPRDIEVTVYGATKETFEKVTRKPGSFKAFQKGLNLLLDNRIKVRLKAMALKSNLAELPKIAEFCRNMTKDYFRFDPFLHLRFDRDSAKNKEIKTERLAPGEIAELERSDSERFDSLKKECGRLVSNEFKNTAHHYLFSCGAGVSSFTLGYDGFFRLCSSLYHPDCMYDLRKGTLKQAWDQFVPLVRNLNSNKKAFVENCRVCPIVNLCMWCPAHSYLEKGAMDEPVDYFCRAAHQRHSSIKNTLTNEKNRNNL
ncbi:MAG: radical SAM protein [Candidatus Aminicenantes bacterium]|nr:radical SAM protein [Candidatus Aminicenantes bacterium]